MALESGTRFGPYEVVGLIGAGGMGEVYRAKDPSLKRDVALKILPESVAADADRLLRFQREAEILASLNHPNIAQIYGLERCDGQIAIVMELIEGPTLADRIEGGRLPPEEALGIAFQVAAALEAAHERQIVHRDLKPANIKIRSDGTVKVLDFGISKPLNAAAISGGSPVMTTPAVTQTGVILGTAAYMSPEQARGKAVDQRTDVWAFGCLLFEMLTGQPAFGGEDVMLTLARVLDRDTDMSSIPNTVSAAIRHTIKLCLEKDPRRRIADIRDVRLALEGRFESLPVRADRGGERRPLWLRAVSLAVAAVGGGVVAAMALKVLETPPAAPEVNRSVYTIPSELRSVSGFGSIVLALSPDGRELAFAGDNGIYRRRLDELDARLIPGTDGQRPLDPHYSPDGRNILYGANRSEGAALNRVPVEGGTPQSVLDHMPATGWQWPEDDTIYYADFMDDTCTIWRDSSAGGSSEPLLRVPGLNCVEPVALPGGRYLIFDEHPTSLMEQAQIVIYDLESKQEMRRFPGKQAQFVEPGYLVYYDYALGVVATAFDPETLRFGETTLAFVDDVLERPGRMPQFRVSPSGTLAYLRGSKHLNGAAALGIVDDSAGVRMLNLPRAQYEFPVGSPDGSRLAVVIVDADGSSDVYVYDLAETSEIRPLTSRGDATSPAWSPDSEWVLYASSDLDHPGIYRRRADGSGREELIVESTAGRRIGLPAFAPDGRLAFTQATPDGTPEIRIGTPADRESEPLIEGVRAFDPQYSPDGRAIAFVSQPDNAGRPEVWVAKVGDADNRHPASIADVSSIYPFWIGDHTLAYQTLEGIAAVDVDTDTLNLSRRRTLPVLIGALNNDSPPVAGRMPGTDEFVAALREQQSANGATDSLEVVIIENWIREVEARLPLLD